LLGLKPGSYEAYCFDEAIWFLGVSIEQEMEKASHKPTKEERRTTAARQRVLDKYFETEEEKDKGFADPALLFG
jgi:hypothetical protein